jgi:RNA polymerase sigma-70 factor (ECF subfamily)
MNNYKKIIKGVKSSDYHSQMQFYDMFANTTYRSAFAILEDSNEAEEIMQDTMLKIFTKTHLIHEDEMQMCKIARRIAVNAAIDMLRKQKANFKFDNIENIADCADEENDVDENVYTVEKIKQAISSLALGYKTIVTLRLLENMNFDDISKTLQISANTVRSQYSRALTKLRDYLINN